jgi:cobalt-zinc-cadmium efflux system outer membrane protein
MAYRILTGLDAAGRTGRRLACAAMCLFVLSGCASVQPGARFPAVQQVAQDRLGQRVVWDRGGPEGEAIRRTVDALLSRSLTAEGAVQIALLNDSGLQAVFEDLGVAQADLVQAG